MLTSHLMSTCEHEKNQCHEETEVADADASLNAVIGKNIEF